MIALAGEPATSAGAEAPAKVEPRGRVLGRFPMRVGSHASGARVEVFEHEGERKIRLINFDGVYAGLATLSDLRCVFEEAAAFQASLDGGAPRKAQGAVR